MKLECPYCEHEFALAYSNEEQDEYYQEECTKCGKIFVYEIEIEITTKSRKSDCLNGGEHKFVKTECYPEFMAQRYCDCGESEFIYSMEVRKEMAKKYKKELGL